MKSKLKTSAAFKEQLIECSRNESCRGVSRLLTKDFFMDLGAFFNKPLGSSLFGTSFLLSSARGFRLQGTSIAIWVCKILATKDLWRKWSSAIPRNLLSLIKAVSWGQAPFADLLWTRIYSDIPSYSLPPLRLPGEPDTQLPMGQWLIWLSTAKALNIRLVQEAHNRKLSAVSWFLLLIEWGKLENKSHHY